MPTINAAHASAADFGVDTQFGPHKFPGETWTLNGAGAHHIHKYPHAPGGSPEKLGRELYKITIRGNFQNRFHGYPDLYPNTMNKLRLLYEAQTTLTLVHPSAGSFPAFIVGWRQVKEARLRSGEKVDIDFLEDQETQFLASAIGSYTFAGNAMQANAAELASQLAAVRAAEAITLRDPDVSLFDSIQNSVNAILAIKDTSAAYGSLLGAKLQKLVNLCGAVDRLTSMQDPRAWPVMNALWSLWSVAAKNFADLQSRNQLLQIYLVPQTTSLSAIAAHLYGDASKQSDLLSLNAVAIPNPLRVFGGTSIRYYPATG